MEKKDWAILIGIVLIIVFILGAIGNTLYCHIRYWSTPYQQIPYHCPIMNSSK